MRTVGEAITFVTNQIGDKDAVLLQSYREIAEDAEVLRFTIGLIDVDLGFAAKINNALTVGVLIGIHMERSE